MWKKLSVSALTLTLLAGGIVTFAAPIKVENEITRGEFVKTVIEELHVPIGSGQTVQFDDIPEPLKPYIEKAVELRLIKGISPTEFRPDEKLMRGHAFMISARGIQDDKTYAEDVLKQFKDTYKIANGNRQEIAKAVELGLASGFADDMLRPKDYVTEAQKSDLLKPFLEEYRLLQANATVSLRILGTMDIHTNIVNYNYYKHAELSNIGFVETAILIEAARQESANAILLDNGDSIQGTSLGSYIQAVDQLEVPDNHNFNSSLTYLGKMMDDASFSFVNTNVRSATTGKFLYEPYILIEKDVVDSIGQRTAMTIGITGVVPPQILTSDKANLKDKIVVDDAMNAVKGIVPEMKRAGADVVIVLSHSGIGDATHELGEENVSYLLTQIADVDAIITGHSQAKFPSSLDQALPNVDIAQGTMNGVPLVMAGKFGSHLGVIDLQLKKSNDGWDVVAGTGEVREFAK